MFHNIHESKADSRCLLCSWKKKKKKGAARKSKEKIFPELWKWKTKRAPTNWSLNYAHQKEDAGKDSENSGI